MVANAWQHRADVSTSSAVFVGLIGSMMGYPLLDPLAGILVAGVIVRQVCVVLLVGTLLVVKPVCLPLAKHVNLEKVFFVCNETSG